MSTADVGFSADWDECFSDRTDTTTITSSSGRGAELGWFHVAASGQVQIFMPSSSSGCPRSRGRIWRPQRRIAALLMFLGAHFAKQLQALVSGCACRHLHGRAPYVFCVHPSAGARSLDPELPS